MSEPVDYVPFETTVAAPAGASAAGADLERLYDVPVELAVEIGRTQMTIREALALGPGSLVTLNRLAREPVDLLVHGKRIARGGVVGLEEGSGRRVTEVRTAEDDAAPGAPAAAAEPAGAPAPVSG